MWMYSHVHVVHAGDEIAVGSSEVEEVALYEGLAHSGNGAAPRQFVTGITKHDGDKSEELIRARTTWV